LDVTPQLIFKVGNRREADIKSRVNATSPQLSPHKTNTTSRTETSIAYTKPPIHILRIKFHTTTNMPSIVDQLGSLVHGIFSTIVAALGSIVALFQSVFNAILTVFQSIFNAILGVIQTIFAALGSTISGLVHTFEGLFKFLLSNIVVIGALVAAFFLYSVYQQRNGRSVTAAPAKSGKMQ